MQAGGWGSAASKRILVNGQNQWSKSMVKIKGQCSIGRAEKFINSQWLENLLEFLIYFYFI